MRSCAFVVLTLLFFGSNSAQSQEPRPGNSTPEGPFPELVCGAGYVTTIETVGNRHVLFTIDYAIEPKNDKCATLSGGRYILNGDSFNNKRRRLAMTTQLLGGKPVKIYQSPTRTPLPYITKIKALGEYQLPDKAMADPAIPIKD